MIDEDTGTLRREEKRSFFYTLHHSSAGLVPVNDQDRPISKNLGKRDSIIGFRNLRHFTAVLVTQMCTSVHAEGTGTTAKAVALGAKLAAVALFAEDLPRMLGGICGV